MSKERLTERHRTVVCCPANVECTSICDDCDHMGKMMAKLAEYEDLEEQNLLLRLKFKKGQRVYYIAKSCIDGRLFITSMTYSYSCLDFPREYFATKSEAEEKLRELEGK